MAKRLFYGDRKMSGQTKKERAGAKLQAVCDAWNAKHRVGAIVTFWPGTREGEGKIGSTRSEAFVLGGHTAVVQINGYAGCVALTHVEPVGQG